MSQPLKRILVVVRRDQPELYAEMRQRYRDVAVVILTAVMAKNRRRPPFKTAAKRGPWERWSVGAFSVIA